MDRIPIISTPKFAVWLILFLSILVYSHTLVCQFVYDDLAITVMENPALLGTANVWEILTWDRPLREFTYMADHVLWGFHPFGYHLQNIIWHAANGVLLYFLLMYLGVKKEGSLAIALLFAVHPINTEAVAWVSGRKELLCLFFELTACFLFVSALNKEKIHFPKYFLSILALILALLSKQVAVATPFLCLACWVFFLAKKGRAIHIKKALLGVAPLFIITIFFIFFRYDVIHRLDVIHSKGTFYDPSARDVSFTFLSAILTPFATFAKSIWLFIYPIDLTIERGFDPVTSLFDIRWVIGFLLIIGLPYLAICTFKRVPAIALGLFWLIITWGPISGFAPVAYLLADRYLYIPCIGFCIAGISWAAYLLARYPQRYKIGLLALICLFFTVRTVDRTFDWKNEFTLWQSAVAARPENPKGYINLGNAYFDRDDIDTALKHWRKALSLQQDLPQVWVNMGNAIKRKGDFAEAETCYRKALELLPRYGLAHFNLALLLEKQGKPDAALKHMLIAAEYMYGKRNENRRKGLAHYHCARMLAARQEMAKALPHLVRAERLAPRFAPLYLLKGTLADNPQDARQAFEMAIRLDPTYGEAYFNLGVLEWRLGNTSSANQLWEKAVEFNPSIQEMVENIKKTTNS